MTTTTVDESNVTIDDVTDDTVTNTCLIVNLVIRLKLLLSQLSKYV